MRCSECGNIMLDEIVWKWNVIRVRRSRCINRKCENYQPYYSSDSDIKKKKTPNWSNMKSSEILKLLDKTELEVITDKYNVVYVRYKDAGVLIGDKIDRKYGCTYLDFIYGRGRDFESACDDYLSKIMGRTLVFDPYGSNRHEIEIPIGKRD